MFSSVCFNFFSCVWLFSIFCCLDCVCFAFIYSSDWKVCFLFPVLVVVVFELNKDHPNEGTQTLFMQSWPRESSAPSLVFLRGSKQEGSGKLCRKGRLQVCFLFWGCCHREAGGWRRRSRAYDGIRSGSIWTFSGWSWVGQSEDKELGSWQSMLKSRPFQASGCRAGDLAPGLVAPKVLGHGFLVMYCLAIVHLYIGFSLSRNYIWGLVLIVPSTKWHVVRWVIHRTEIFSLHSHFLLILLTNLGFSTKVVINVLILDCIFCLKLWPKFRFYVLMFTACLYTPASPLLSSGSLGLTQNCFQSFTCLRISLWLACFLCKMGLRTIIIH